MEGVLAENVLENMIALPHPEKSQSIDMSTQTESEDSRKDETTSTNLSTKESEESLITEKPVFKKKKTIENKKTLKQNLDTDFKQRGFDFNMCIY